MKKKMSMLMAAAITAGMLSGVTVNAQEWRETWTILSLPT